MTILFHTTTSKVTRNSNNEALLREQCKAALVSGGYFEITEAYGPDCWWTVFTIVVPVVDPTMPGDEA